jgi:ribosomal protein S27AE
MHMSLSTYYRAQAQKCLSLSRTCSDCTQATQLAFMANRYFERAEELEQDVRLERTPVSSHDEARRPKH